MRKIKAFTFVEILIVVLILGALAVIALPRITNASKAAKDRICRTNIDLINKQVELFHLNMDSWPQHLTDVTGNTDYFPDGPPECPFGWDYEIDSSSYHVIDHGDHTQEAQSGGGGGSAGGSGGSDGGSGGSDGGSGGSGGSQGGDGGGGGGG